MTIEVTWRPRVPFRDGVFTERDQQCSIERGRGIQREDIHCSDTKRPTFVDYTDEERQNQRHIAGVRYVARLRGCSEDEIDYLTDITYRLLPAHKLVLFPIKIYVPRPEKFYPEHFLLVSQERYMQYESLMIVMLHIDDRVPRWTPEIYGWICISEVKKLATKREIIYDNWGQETDAVWNVPMSRTHHWGETVEGVPNMPTPAELDLLRRRYTKYGRQ